ncbi:unnamed protein product [marine sediment metagenome]|uniref:DUF669 domain-containing protein n=1 Tax=marine sediment metagenome TaxID=412755 RepID=X1F3K9_9ZZZZ
MDYEKEFNELNQTGEGFFKPKQGIYKVKFLEEPEECVFKKEGEDDVPQVKVKVTVGKEAEESLWYITKGSTNKSLYGQLMAIGNFYGNLTDRNITLMVNTIRKDGKDQNTYTVQEAIEIIAKLDKDKPVTDTEEVK